TKWIQSTKSNKILIVDDELVDNAFMVNIFKMTAPAGVDIEIVSTDEIAARSQSGALSEGTIMALFKFVKTLKAAYDKGFRFESVQVAGLGSGPGKKVVFRTVSLSEEDARLLKDLDEQDVKVYFQSIPEERSVMLDAVLKKFFREL
ncbi:MAG: PTS sugar transporter subunit IIB, partial [Clostridiales Family XIII bacterium]|nr:PTS sugar transporter subunit IIB [Clostridiales Family XIII bacterium]